MSSRNLLLISLCIIACDRGPQNRSADTASLLPTPAQETVAVAQARYNPALFDTTAWVNDSSHLARGGDVFRWACAQCHGPRGEGDGGYVLDGDTLHPPSFQNPSWRFAKDEEGLRRRIFIGNARGMPHWGLRRMEPNDIIAVEKYILYDLREN